MHQIKHLSYLSLCACVHDFALFLLHIGHIPVKTFRDGSFKKKRRTPPVS